MVKLGRDADQKADAALGSSQNVIIKLLDLYFQIIPPHLLTLPPLFCMQVPCEVVRSSMCLSHVQ